MSFVRTLILAAVAAALGAWLWFVEAPKLEQEAKANLLLDFDPAAVEKVRLAYPDGMQIEVVRDAGTWKLTAPVAYAADGNVVDNFLTTVKEATIERRMARSDAGALSTYGLEGDTGSQARIELTLGGNKPLPAVVLGIATPVGHQAFARREGEDDVFVIPLLLQSSAKKTPDELRAKTMFAGRDSTGIKHVTIEKPDEKIELERSGDAAWTMRSPIDDLADAESVRSMLDSLATIDALAFFDGAAADRNAFGLETGATRFVATHDDGSTVAFVIGKEATDAPAGNYLERAGDQQVVKVPDWVAKKFAPVAAELRDRRLLSCKVDDIRGMTFTMGGETFTLAREGTGKPWTIDPPADGEVLNQRIVDNVLEGLASARADEVIGDANTDAELAQYGLDAPLARLDVAGASGPCAALSAAAMPAPAPAPEGRPAAAAGYVMKNAARSAVLNTSAHEYSRIAMKRPAFVEAAAKAAGSGAAPSGAAPQAAMPDDAAPDAAPPGEPSAH